LAVFTDIDISIPVKTAKRERFSVPINGMNGIDRSYYVNTLIEALDGSPKSCGSKAKKRSYYV
jgi:hypothetical protein